MTTPTGRIREAVERLVPALQDAHNNACGGTEWLDIALQDGDAALLAEALPLLVALYDAVKSKHQFADAAVGIASNALAALDRGTEAK